MNYLNDCKITGRVSVKNAIPEKNGDGIFVLNFNVAQERRYKDKASGEFKKETQFLPCSIFGKNADLANTYIEVGDLVLIESNIQLNEYMNKDGVQVKTLKIVAYRFTILAKSQKNSAAKKGDNYGNSVDPSQQAYAHENGFNDNIPYFLR